MASLTGISVRDIPYGDYSNRQLAAIPLTLFVVAVGILAAWTLLTGSPVAFGLDFVGGVEVRIAPQGESDLSRGEVLSVFSEEPSSIRKIPSDGSYVVTFREGTLNAEEVRQQVEQSGLAIRSISTVSASFGRKAQSLALGGILVAFTGMSLLVFGLFRSFVPSVAVIASGVIDLVVPLAVMNLLGIKLSLGTVAALLMLIGYSVDSDLVLNDHVFRRPGDFEESAYNAMETGVTMTLTSMTAMIVMTIAAFVSGVELLTSMGVVLLIGLCVDLINTYMMNYSLLRWYKYKGVAR